jgi:hypothetical protein
MKHHSDCSASLYVFNLGDRNDKNISSFPVLTASLRYSVSANYKYTHVWDSVGDLSAAGEPSRPPVITVMREGQLLKRAKGSTAVNIADSNGTAPPSLLFPSLLTCPSDILTLRERSLVLYGR